MPKIKDLGINIVPGTMRPPEIGDGGGGGGGDDTSPSLCDCNPTVPPACGSQCDCVSDVEYIVTPKCPRPCLAHSRGTPITEHTPNLSPGSLSRKEIEELREALKKALENLDVAEKNLLPKTIEEVDKLAKVLQQELDALKARRAELEKK